MEYLSELSKEKRESIKHYFYDDMCHLKVVFMYFLHYNFYEPYSENSKRAEQNEVTKYFSEQNKYVDFFHFPGTVEY